MDYRQRARINQDKSMRIKHMAFAVKSVDKALLNFQSFLSVSSKTEKVIWEKAETKVAIFFINDIEFQLCESLNKVLDHAKKHNAKLRICEACKVYGSHPHPEGFVAFLDDEVSGTEIEFMQVYTEAELEKHKISGV